MYEETVFGNCKYVHTCNTLSTSVCIYSFGSSWSCKKLKKIYISKYHNTCVKLLIKFLIELQQILGIWNINFFREFVPPNVDLIKRIYFLSSKNELQHQSPRQYVISWFDNYGMKCLCLELTAIAIIECSNFFSFSDARWFIVTILTS